MKLLPTQEHLSLLGVHCLEELYVTVNCCVRVCVCVCVGGWVDGCFYLLIKVYTSCHIQLP